MYDTETPSCTRQVGRFDELRERVWRECMSLLSERTRATGEFVQNIINMEVAYINTDNPEFEKIRTGVYRLMAAHQSMPAKTEDVATVVPSSKPKSGSRDEENDKLEASVGVLVRTRGCIRSSVV